MFSRAMHIVPVDIYGYTNIVVPALYFNSVIVFNSFKDQGHSDFAK